MIAELPRTGLAVAPVVNDDVIKVAAKPDDRIFEIVQIVFGQPSNARINARPLHDVGGENAVRADKQQ
jgi:hypothetical protein